VIEADNGAIRSVRGEYLREVRHGYANGRAPDRSLDSAALAGNSRNDPAPKQGSPAFDVIIGFVCVEFSEAFPGMFTLAPTVSQRLAFSLGWRLIPSVWFIEEPGAALFYFGAYSQMPRKLSGDAVEDNYPDKYGCMIEDDGYADRTMVVKRAG
jgi:hypothetical protein